MMHFSLQYGLYKTFSRIKIDIIFVGIDSNAISISLNLGIFDVRFSHLSHLAKLTCTISDLSKEINSINSCL